MSIVYCKDCDESWDMDQEDYCPGCGKSQVCCECTKECPAAEQIAALKTERDYLDGLLKEVRKDLKLMQETIEN